MLTSLLFLFACSTEAPTENVAAPAGDAAAPSTAAPAGDVAAPAGNAAAPAGDAAAAAPAGDAAAVAGGTPTDWKPFGTDFASTEVMQASALLQDPSKYLNKTVVVEGRITDVCQKAGCWMVIADGDKTMRITMKDHGFSIDKDASGRTCQVQGMLVEKPVDPETVAHYEGESTPGSVIPEKAAQGGKTYEIVATGVRLKQG